MRTNHKTINELLALDLEILSDVDYPPCQVCGGSGERNICVTIVPCEGCGGSGRVGAATVLYAMGWRNEIAAGLRGGHVTPWKQSLEELESHCAANRDELMKHLVGK